MKFVHTLANLVMAVDLHTNLSTKNFCKENSSLLPLVYMDSMEMKLGKQGLLYLFFIFVTKQTLLFVKTLIRMVDISDHSEMTKLSFLLIKHNLIIPLFVFRT